MKELWIPIRLFGIKNYIISNKGRVARVDKNGKTIIKKSSPNKKRNGYHYVYLSGSGKRKNAILHRLVAHYFCRKPTGKEYVNHKNFNTADNRAQNLEWVTAKENIHHTINAGRRKILVGEQCGCSKLTRKIVRKIAMLLKGGGYTYREIAKIYGTNYSNIAHIKRGSRWYNDTKDILNK